MRKTETGWDRHDAEQRRRWMRLSPLERLRWLDDAKRFVERTRRRSDREPAPKSPTEGEPRDL
jgi:hypothetical protein